MFQCFTLTGYSSDLFKRHISVSFVLATFRPIVCTDNTSASLVLGTVQLHCTWHSSESCVLFYSSTSTVLFTVLPPCTFVLGTDQLLWFCLRIKLAAKKLRCPNIILYGKKLECNYYSPYLIIGIWKNIYLSVVENTFFRYLKYWFLQIFLAAEYLHKRPQSQDLATSF